MLDQLDFQESRAIVATLDRSAPRERKASLARGGKLVRLALPDQLGQKVTRAIKESPDPWVPMVPKVRKATLALQDLKACAAK